MNNFNINLTYEMVRREFNYNSNTGILKWLNPKSHRILKDKSVGFKASNGRFLVHTHNSVFSVDRVIWLWYYGKWPDKIILHLNGNKSDCRIFNMIDAPNDDNLTSEYLHKYFIYNKKYSVLIWKIQQWNNMLYRGIKCAGSVNNSGYLMIEIGKGIYGAHRLIWLYLYDKWPDNFIDHINGNTLDNRLDNIRDVTHQENQQNRIEHRNGNLVGANYIVRSKTWESAITFNKIRYRLGHYNTAKLANEAYTIAYTLLKSGITDKKVILDKSKIKSNSLIGRAGNRRVILVEDKAEYG